jgi:hypothetical protein
MTNKEIIILCLVIVYITTALILLITAYVKYKTFLELKRKIEPEYVENLGGLWVNDGGGWFAGTFQFRTPLPIEDKSNDESIKKAVSEHNKIITYYWIWMISILPVGLLVKLLI